MTVLVAKIIWCVGVVSWFIIRYPYARRRRRTVTVRAVNRNFERVLLLISTCGLGILPALYVFSDVLSVANYPIQIWQPWLGCAAFAIALWIFRKTHSALGRNWSVTLEIRAEHTLVTAGIYKYIRHPMYTAFWLWAVAQALLLPNWIAGFSGIVGFGTLYLLRIEREEGMLLETFGDEYRTYMKRTWQIMPGLH